MEKAASADGSDDESHGILPSRFMRQRRPEIYSDTAGRTDYEVDASILDHHLETLTRRNQTHDFETFCRKLCERAIYPNLRAQTGPDGGGDSKADSESFAVADELSDIFFEGEANAGRERWGFAFSAKERWQQKIRDDVDGLLKTGRNYDRIICVTSRYIKSKARTTIRSKSVRMRISPISSRVRLPPSRHAHSSLKRRTTKISIHSWRCTASSAPIISFRRSGTRE